MPETAYRFESCRGHLGFVTAPVAQLDRVPDYGSGGWGFESSRARQANAMISSYLPVPGTVHLIWVTKKRGINKVSALMTVADPLISVLYFK